MASIGCDPTALGGTACEARDRSLAAALVTAHASSSTATQLTVATGDGDRVTLSSRTEAQLDVATYDVHGRLADGGTIALRATSATLQLSRAVAIEVEGTLDAEELKDLARLARTLGTVVARVERGDLDGAIRKAARAERLDSIAGVELLVTHLESIAVSRAPVTTTEPAGAVPAPPAGGAAAPAAGAEPATVDDLVARLDGARRDLVAWRGRGLLGQLIALLQHLRRTLADAPDATAVADAA